MTAKIVIDGVVQGVGFRQFVQSYAKQRDLKGWVFNRSDGKLEVQCKGEKSAIEELITLCKQGPFAAAVNTVSVEWGIVKEFPDTFIIKQEYN